MARVASLPVFLWILACRVLVAYAALVNVTIHHADRAASYSTEDGSTAVSLKFNGTAIYVFRDQKAIGSSYLQFQLDGVPHSVPRGKESPICDYCVFTQTSLPFVEHTLRIKSSVVDAPNAIFGHAIYTVDDTHLPSITPNADQHSQQFTEAQGIWTSKHTRTPRSLSSIGLDTGLALAIFIPLGLVVFFIAICCMLLFIRRNRNRKQEIEPFVLVSPMPKTPLPTGSESGFSAPNSAMPILNEFDFERHPDNGSILESVVSMGMAVTPIPSEVEEIYAQLEVLSTQVESLHKRDSSIYPTRPESIRRQSQEAKRIQEDVENLRLDINRLKLESTLGRCTFNCGASAIAESIASNFATANSVASITDSLTPLTRPTSTTNSTVPYNNTFYQF
ncbi:hypothetical protein BDY19DRAFT_925384, partial [Irpex rosettiformis]